VGYCGWDGVGRGFVDPFRSGCAYEPSAALCNRAGYLALHEITHSFDIQLPHSPHFPDDPISISRAEFDEALTQLAAAGLPIKSDREQAWKDFAGWRVNYDRALIELCKVGDGALCAVVK